MVMAIILLFTNYSISVSDMQKQSVPAASAEEGWKNTYGNDLELI